MDIWAQLLQGFATAATPMNLLWAFVGCALGTAIGVLPGLGPAVTVAMLLPITSQVEPTASMIFFAGIYYGAMYGGSTTSILMRIPGEAASVMTCIDGYAMTQRGRAGPALAIAAIGSFVAGTLSVIALMLLAPTLASFVPRPDRVAAHRRLAPVVRALARDLRPTFATLAGIAAGQA